jgi:hypothetical protein
LPGSSELAGHRCDGCWLKSRRFGINPDGGAATLIRKEVIEIVLVTLRCTKKLLGRLRVPEPIAAVPPSTPVASTTALGDWYATLVFARPKRLVLCVSERSRLAVVMEAAPLTSLAARFRPALREVLQALGVSEAAITREEAEMSSSCFGPTQSRSILGTMNEYVRMLEVLEDDPEAQTLLEKSLFLSRIICSPLQWRHPDEVTRELLEVPEAE